MMKERAHGSSHAMAPWPVSYKYKTTACMILSYRLCNISLSSNCICPGYTLTFAECTVVGRPVGYTVWRGTAFDCVSGELTLFHSNFTSDSSNVRDCNDGAIVGQGLRVEDNCYTSQLNITVRSDMIGKTIKCVYDDVNTETTVGSLRIVTTGEKLITNNLYT